MKPTHRNALFARAAAAAPMVALACAAVALPGCAVVVAGAAVVSTAATVTFGVASTAVDVGVGAAKVTGKVVGTGIDALTPHAPAPSVAAKP